MYIKVWDARFYGVDPSLQKASESARKGGFLFKNIIEVALNVSEPAHKCRRCSVSPVTKAGGPTQDACEVYHCPFLLCQAEQKTATCVFPPANMYQENFVMF